ncbi:hypothetical protein LB823_19455 [Tsukamurella sp. M9C]|uniref:hypothetical protein n=1 Tax=Tsukamurella sp. M9C TaxID=2877520 RepID=UPI001CCC761C|nr:hypothetical protein [Tsukamurella sp. M9C]MCA0158378.1 hypothetical protein [Tsukamurella sp. M9C]
MSDSCSYVISLAPPGDPGRRQRAEAVAEIAEHRGAELRLADARWCLDEARADPRIMELCGHAYRGVIDASPDFRDGAYDADALEELAISRWRSMYPQRPEIDLGFGCVTAVEATDDPRCPGCARDFTEIPMGEWCQQWFDSRVEPTVTCNNCGTTGLIGDWQGEGGTYFTDCAVALWNWPTLSLVPGLDAELLRAIGPRPRIVYAHM